MPLPGLQAGVLIGGSHFWVAIGVCLCLLLTLLLGATFGFPEGGSGGGFSGVMSGLKGYLIGGAVGELFLPHSAFSKWNMRKVTIFQAWK